VTRLSTQVVQTLLDEMDRLVCSYHEDVRRSGRNVADLIPGTAFFPGGTGVWQGDTCFGPIPEYFPDSPVMFVAHNFDSIGGYEASQQKGGEVDSFFWQVLRQYLTAAGISAQDVYFTNALMGIKPGSALGNMPTVAGYEEECRDFLIRQIEIVGPRAIVALGGKAAARLGRINPSIPWIGVLHPSARELKARSTRSTLIAEQGVRILQILSR
jgi:uracil-DNA glycosylase family 4